MPDVGALQHCNNACPALKEAQLGTLLNSLIASATIQLCAKATTVYAVKTVYPVTFEIAGQFYQKAITDNFWATTTTCSTGSGKWNAVYLYISTAGAASIQAWVDGSSTPSAIASWAALLPLAPALDQTKALVAILVLNPSSAFTGGSSDLDSVGGAVYAWPGLTSLNMILT